jgi:hypothetical protein
MARAGGTTPAEISRFWVCGNQGAFGRFRLAPQDRPAEIVLEALRLAVPRRGRLLAGKVSMM